MTPPSIDISKCILCEICVEIAPDIFHLNEAGYIEVKEQDTYSVNKIHMAKINCPQQCIE